MISDLAITGVGVSDCVEKKGELTLAEMIFGATKSALNSAGIDRDVIDSVVLGASDLMDGISISSMVLACAAGAYLKDEIKVADDGIFALILAGLRLLSNEFKTSLVVSWCKSSQTSLDVVTRLNFDPCYTRPIGLSMWAAHALQACRYQAIYGNIEKAAAGIVVKNRSHGKANPVAHLRAAVDMKTVLEGRTICTPLKALDIAPSSDGVCALVLTRDRKLISHSKQPVFVKGIGWSTSGYDLGDRDLSRLLSLHEAANMAYRQANIKKPFNEIDLAEIYDVTSYHEIMAYEALGLCPWGGGRDFAESGETKYDGHLPVNLSGGLLSSNPWSAAGLFRVGEACLQLTKSSRGLQISKAKTALAHGESGFAGQKNAVIILGV